MEVWDAYQAGDLRRAQEAQRKAIEIFNVLVNFKYFFTRKLMFIKEVHAVTLFPGGFGTQDEGFDLGQHRVT